MWASEAVRVLMMDRMAMGERIGRKGALMGEA